MIETKKDQTLRDPSNIVDIEYQLYQWNTRESLYGVPEDNANTGW